MGIPGSSLEALNGEAQRESAQAMELGAIWKILQSPPRQGTEIITVPCVDTCPHGYKMNEKCECKPVIAICRWWQFC